VPRSCQALIAIVVAIMLTGLHPPGGASADGIEGLVAKLRPALVGVKVIFAETTHASNKLTEDLTELIRSSGVPVPSSPAVRSAAGTGILISADGLLLTASALFTGPGEIVVHTDTGAAYRGQLVARDNLTGLVLVKIDAAGLPHVQLAPPAALEPGETVLGLGRNAAGGEAGITFVQGTITAPAGAAPQAVPYIHATYATSAAMGGGPMVRLKTGEVIGFNTLRYLPPGKAETTFATPVTEFLRIETDLKTHGRVRRAAIGITPAVLTPDVGRLLGFANDKAVLVADVRPGGPAHAAGVQRGDVITRVGESVVVSPAELNRAIGLNQPGDEIRLTLYRKLKQLVVTVKAEEAQLPGRGTALR
jgi:S1-C subfamily serine protease